MVSAEAKIRIFSLAIAVVVVLGFFAAGYAVMNKYSLKQANTNAGTIKIGCTYYTQGPLAGASQEIANGLKLWASQANKIGINVAGKIYGVQVVCKKLPQPTALQASLTYNALVQNDKVDYLVGPAGNDLSAAAGQVAEGYRKLMIFTLQDDEGYFVTYKPQYEFQIMTPMAGQVETLLSAVKFIDKNITNVVVVYENTTYSSYAEKTIESVLSATKGFRLVKVFSFQPNSDPAPIAGSIATQRLNPNLVVVVGVDGDKITNLVSALKHQGLTTLRLIAVIAPPTALTSLEKHPNTANGIIYVSQWEPIEPFNPFMAKNLSVEWYGYATPDTFTQDYLKMYGDTPDYYAALGYEAGLIIQAALEKAESLDSSVLKDTINNMRIMTFYGIVGFQDSKYYPGGYHGAQAAHQTLIVQFQLVKGHLVKQVVYPTELATGKPVYPVK